MADLILTDEEKAADLWSDLDDASLGRMVRHTMHVMREVNEESERPVHLAAAYFLIGFCAEMNATDSFIECEGFTLKGEEMGDWKVSIERTKKPPHCGKADR